MSSASKETSTRERLVEAAGPLFAEKGFDGATVREICDAAGANVAAVNYHFGGKEGLYAEVVADVIRRRTEMFPMDGGLAGESACLASDRSPEERLRAFVRAFLSRRFDRARPEWWGKLLAREMRNPCEAVRPVVEKERRGNRRLLAEIVASLLGPAVEQDASKRCAASVVGQVLHYFHGHHVASGASGCGGMTPEGIDELARHITEFSLGGVERIRKAGDGSRRARRRD